MTQAYDPVAFLPYLQIDGLTMGNNNTTPNTQIDVSAGICRDSTNVFDLNLGNYNGAIPNQSANVTTTIDATLNGLNGLDTGSLGASKLYYIYVISNPLGAEPVGLILSLSSTGPLLPTPYFVYRIIGAVATDGSSHFALFDMSGNHNERLFIYDTPIATSITTGNATTYTNISLVASVPLFDRTQVIIDYAYTPNAASHTLSIAQPSSSGYAIKATAQVASVIVTGQQSLVSRLASISSVVVPSVAYKVSNSSDAVAISVSGFKMSC